MKNLIISDFGFHLVNRKTYYPSVCILQFYYIGLRLGLLKHGTTKVTIFKALLFLNMNESRPKTFMNYSLDHSWQCHDGIFTETGVFFSNTHKNHLNFFETNFPKILLICTNVSTHCNCSVTVHLIYSMENGSVPLKNGLIQHKSKNFKIFFPKIPSERLGPGASFLC